VHEGASSWAEQLAGERLTLWRCGWELRSAQLRREGARLAELGEEGAGLERQAQRALRGGSMCARSMLGALRSASAACYARRRLAPDGVTDKRHTHQI
jgi:hypothetical protein